MSRLNASQIILNERLRVAAIVELQEGAARPSLARGQESSRFDRRWTQTRQSRFSLSRPSRKTRSCWRWRKRAWDSRRSVRRAAHSARKRNERPRLPRTCSLSIRQWATANKGALMEPIKTPRRGAKRRAATLVAPVLEKLTGAPPLADTIGPASTQASFMDSSDGRGQRLSFARYHVSPMFYSGYGGGMPLLSNPAHRDRSLAAAVTSEQIVSNPTLATIIETLTTHTVGTGLRLDSRVCADEIGVTEDEAHGLAETIERRWEQWASNPLECDLTGRFTIYDMAATAFISWLCTGEVIYSIDWAPARDTETGTKVALLEPRQIDLITRTAENGNVFQGIEFDARGRISALWLRRTPTGDTFKVGISERYATRTAWGRQKLVFLIEQLFPHQIRGLSPLVAALGPSQDRLMLQEVTTASSGVAGRLRDYA